MNIDIFEIVMNGILATDEWAKSADKAFEKLGYGNYDTITNYIPAYSALWKIIDGFFMEDSLKIINWWVSEESSDRVVYDKDHGMIKLKTARDLWNFLEKL